MKIEKWQAACLIALAFAGGAWCYRAKTPAPKDRTVLKAIVSLAKWALLVAPFILDSDQGEPVYNRTALEYGEVDHARSL